MALPVRMKRKAATGTAKSTKTVADVISGSKLKTPNTNIAPPMVMKMVDTVHTPTSKSTPMHPEAKPRFGASPFWFRLLILIATRKNSREDKEFLSRGNARLIRNPPEPAKHETIRPDPVSAHALRQLFAFR